MSLLLARGIVVVVAALTFGAISSKAAEPADTLSATPPSTPPPSTPSTEVERFYQARSSTPAWTGSEIAESNRRIALAALADAAKDGLEPRDYVVPEPAGGGADAAAQYERALTKAVLQFAHDVRNGRISANAIQSDIRFSDAWYDAATALDGALRAGALKQFFADLPPPQPGYAQLKRALAAYREIAASGGWETIPSAAAVEKPSARATQALRARLNAEKMEIFGGPVPADLSAAVGEFQERRGLDATGRVDAATLEELNIAASVRVAQIATNMERWRWLPRALGTSYVEVNTADATLTAVDQGSVVLASRIVAGKPTSPTPMFTAVVTDVTVNPSWHVPTRIARREIWPKTRHNRGYLGRHRMVVGENGSIRQLPGRGNALGRVKLEMANSFNAYLHDTPAKSLFAQNERHDSHGCMRVQEILPLASFALTRSTAAGREQIDAAVARGKTQRIALDRELPIYIMYWTATANGDGTVDFRRDVYGRDTRLIAALDNRHSMSRVTMNEPVVVEP